eukprot:CAMPEP_0119311776 /NCGR_PEP_ID=MMETSP1333-20130426/23835_1 /TAXON_ID=418940 /ORGANISM="Scyphosphaera apsteinii, Strain RCC1455" /LENGTH=127 /DNA_ID=CAMNT_0007316247 /DNA_START=193 /DNA_END=576 /DNA_ORIENTATION=+
MIAGIMLIVPGANLLQDGVDFDSFSIAGKAEVRAYYAGTALCIAWVCLTSEIHTALRLRAIAIVLGGFAGSRVLGYALDGVDSDPVLRFHQNAVFASEMLGTGTALVLQFVVASASEVAVGHAAKMS